MLSVYADVGNAVMAALPALIGGPILAYNLWQWVNITLLGLSAAALLFSVVAWTIDRRG